MVDVAHLRAAKQSLLMLLSVALIAVVVFLASRDSDEPQRCPDGTVHGPTRCCPEGQEEHQGRCTGYSTRCPVGLRVVVDACVATPKKILLSAGRLKLDPIDWESDAAAIDVQLPAFLIDRYEVTNHSYDLCVQSKKCEPISKSEQATPEPGRPALVDVAEAKRYCASLDGSLPTAEQFMWATMGKEGYRYPWGNTGAVCRRASFGLLDGPCDERAQGPELVGLHAAGATPTGIYDLAGNASEWARVTKDDKDTGSVRAFGGSWRDGSAADLRPYSSKVGRPSATGFRCVWPAP